MTPPPATAVADLMRPTSVPQDSQINTDVMSVTKGVSWQWGLLLGLALIGVAQAITTLAWQTYVGLGIAGLAALRRWRA